MAGIEGDVRKIYKKEDKEKRKCPNCESEVEKKDKFCWNCAHPLDGRWMKKCATCGRLFRTVKPRERNTCNSCEDESRKRKPLGLFRA